LLCEPLETTANGKRLVVEDSAACQKTIQSPVAQQVLKTDGVGNLTWTNGTSGTVLGKDSTGKVEFATLNSVLQSGPVDLGSQPLTTTGDIVTSGSVTSKNIKTTGTGADNNITFINTSNTVGMQGMRLAFDSDRMTVQRASDSGAFEANYVSIIQDNGNVGIGTTTPVQKLDIYGNLRVDGVIYGQPFGTGDVLHIGNDCKIVDIGVQNVYGLYGLFSDLVGGIKLGSAGPTIYGASNNFGINTTTPAKTLHVNGTVRLQGLPIYANNAAAITGGLVADDVYKTSTGELRIVV
jgi:hypothetical protein